MQQEDETRLAVAVMAAVASLCLNMLQSIAGTHQWVGL